MDTAIAFAGGILIFSGGFLAFAVFTNVQRERKQYAIELKPNCLLTRHPIVFLTGRRSLFYFRKYWNAFPVVLAEHGYEVFTLHLPWEGPDRRQKLEQFLSEPQNKVRKFHFVMDRDTQSELSETLRLFPSVLSQTVPNSAQSAAPGSLADETSARFLYGSLVSRLSLWLHHKFSRNPSTAPLQADELGGAFPKGSASLLERMQDLGEQDFLR